MPLQSTGAIKMSDICNQFGIPQSAVKFSTLYKGGGNISTNNPSVPPSGLIKMSEFYGGAASTPTSTSMGSTTLTTNSATYMLASYLSDPSSSGAVTYTITANPIGNASVSGGVLTINGNNRGTTYTVTVQATNQYGSTATSSVTVTESSAGVCPDISGQYDNIYNYYTQVSSAGYWWVTINVTTGSGTLQMGGSSLGVGGGIYILSYTGGNCWQCPQGVLSKGNGSIGFLFNGNGWFVVAQLCS